MPPGSERELRTCPADEAGLQLPALAPAWAAVLKLGLLGSGIP